MTTLAHRQPTYPSSMRALLCLLIFVAACEGPPGPPGRILELRPDDDTFVNEGDTDLSNDHVGDEILIVSSQPPSYAFMKWEISAFPDVFAAHLRYEASTTDLATLSVWGSDEDGWDGDKLAFPGQAPTVFLGSAAVATTSESKFDIDVTSWLVEQIVKGPVAAETETEATIAFFLTTSSGTASVGVSSAEEPDHWPKLLILPF